MRGVFFWFLPVVLVGLLVDVSVVDVGVVDVTVVLVDVGVVEVIVVLVAVDESKAKKIHVTYIQFVLEICLLNSVIGVFF